MAVPRSVEFTRMSDLTNPDALATANVEGLADDDREEYLGQLAHLFQQIPSIPSLLHAVDASELVTKQAAKVLWKDLAVIPDLALPTAPAVSSSEVQYVFGVFHCRTHVLQQRIELLASHTLADLRDAVYCVHHQQPADSSAFFCLIAAQAFYLDLQTAGSSAAPEIIKWLEADNIPATPSVPSVPVPSPAPLPATEEVVRRKRNSVADSAALAQSLLQQMSAAPALPLYAKKRQHDERAAAAAAAKRARKSLQPPPAALPPKQCAYTMNSMQTMRLDSVPLQLGEMFLFCHAHCCEHALCLLDTIQPAQVMRSLFYGTRAPASADSICDDSVFPRESYRIAHPRRCCDVCEALPAELVTYHDRLAGATCATQRLGSFFCNECYQMLHYGADRQLLYEDFLSFPYAHDQSSR